MKQLNFLSKSSSQSCSHSSVTLAMTVGSPSAHRRGIMLKLLSVLVLILTLGIGNAWGASATWRLVESQPSDWSGEYLIVYTNCFDGSLTSGFNGSAGQSVTISSDGKSITLDEKYAMIVGDKSNSTYSLKTKSGYYIGRSADSNGVDANQTYTSSSLGVSFGTWNSTNKTVKIAGTGGRCLGNNGGSSWKFFSSSNTYVNVKMYQKAVKASSNNTNYGTVSVSGDVVTASPKSGYRVSTSNPYTISPTGKATVSRSDNVFTLSNVSAVVTLTVNFEADEVAYSISAESNNTNCGTVSLSGSVITGSPKSGYRYASPAYSVSPANSATVAQNGNEFTVTPSANTTVTINFEEIPSHNIIFNTGGLVSIDNASVKEGVTYNIPNSAKTTIEGALTENCEYGTFVGWTTASSIADASVSPSIITSYTMSTSDVTLHAVYSKTVGGSGGASAGTTMFSENWTGVTASTTPSSPTTNGSSVYVSATIGYNWSNGTGNSTSQTYSDGGPNGNANILVAKSNGYWKVTGIPTGGASTLTVSYAKSGSGSITLSTSTANVSVSGTTVTIEEPASVSSFDLKFENTLSSNCRIDDIEITVETAGSTGTTTYSLDANCCDPLGQINGSFLVNHF